MAVTWLMRTGAAVIICVLFALTLGCGGEAGAKPETNTALQDAPKEVAAVYRSNCLSCHGSELQGRVGTRTNLQQVGSRMSEAEIEEQIRTGSKDGTMKPYEGILTDKEINGLAEWLASNK